jgi:hypothetical protein
MIYCVIPRELEGELYEKMLRYYAENPDVTVIVDRRAGGERRRDRRATGTEQRRVRDRRRARIPGTFPLTDFG